MTAPSLAQLENYASFHTAFCMIAERLFLWKGGTHAQWKQWMDSLNGVNSLETDDVSARLASIQKNQLARQQKVECLLFLKDEAAPRMRELMLQRSLPAYINAGSRGLFLADACIFKDERLFEVLRLEDARVSTHVAERCPVLETWKHDYSKRRSGHIVFLLKEIDRALNNDLPLPAAGNEKSVARYSSAQSDINQLDSTARNLRASAFPVNIDRQPICLAVASPETNILDSESKAISSNKKNKGGAPRVHEHFAELGERLLLGKNGMQRFDPSKYQEHRQFAEFRRAVEKIYKLGIDEKTARVYLRPIWEKYRNDQICKDK